jgi:hypothetical protein
VVDQQKSELFYSLAQGQTDFGVGWDNTLDIEPAMMISRLTAAQSMADLQNNSQLAGTEEVLSSVYCGETHIRLID